VRLSRVQASRLSRVQASCRRKGLCHDLDPARDLVQADAPASQAFAMAPAVALAADLVACVVGEDMKAVTLFSPARQWGGAHSSRLPRRCSSGRRPPTRPPTKSAALRRVFARPQHQ